MTLSPVLIIAASLFLLTIVIVVVLWLRVSAWQQNQQTELRNVQQQLQHSQEQNHIARAEITELHTSISNLANHFEQLKQQQQALIEQQTAMQPIDPEAKLYARAAKMIKLGADLSEVMQECELPQAEAQLLFTLHQPK